MRLLRCGFAVLKLMAALACVGCGSPGGQVTTLKIEEVPPELLTAAKQALPGVDFDTAWRKASGTYELRGRAKNGKIREVDLRPDGTVEEVE